MNNRGQLAGWEAVIILVLLITNGFTIYILINKSQNKSIYQADSNPVVTNVDRKDWPFSIHIGEGGCARKGLLNDRQSNRSH